MLLNIRKTTRIKNVILLLLVIVTLTGCSQRDRGNQGTQGQDGQVITKLPKPTVTLSVTKSPEPTKSPEVTVKPEVPSITPQPSASIDPIIEQVNHMTLEEKIGQMVIVGIEGYTIDDRTKNLMEEYHVGGFILFGRNVESSTQLLTLINDLKRYNSINSIPLFVSVDEEGGRVSRMPKELTKLPTNQGIGEVNNVDFSYQIGAVLAIELKAFGFNMDFAPVLDINSNPLNPVIGDRSFGSTAYLVSELGVQTMKGLQDNGMISVVKHFPGHGDTSVDSHIGLPSVNHGLERLESFELLPFQEAIRNQADAMMIAHILLNQIDSKHPASLSKIIVTDLLRNQLGYDKVIVTDDMTMGAIVENYTIREAAVMAVNAGCDVVLSCHGYENEIAVMDALKHAVLDGTITKERVNESVYRILKLKEKYQLEDDTVESIDIESMNQEIQAVLDAYQ